MCCTSRQHTMPQGKCVASRYDASRRRRDAPGRGSHGRGSSPRRSSVVDPRSAQRRDAPGARARVVPARVLAQGQLGEWQVHPPAFRLEVKHGNQRIIGPLQLAVAARRRERVEPDKITRCERRCFFPSSLGWGCRVAHLGGNSELACLCSVLIPTFKRCKTSERLCQKIFKARCGNIEICKKIHTFGFAQIYSICAKPNEKI